MEAAAAGADQILIGNIVLCETVWVLETAYGFDKSEIAEVIGKLLFSSIVAGHGADGMTRSTRISPLLARRGRLRSGRKSREATAASADGVVGAASARICSEV
jgi:predicted nucleic-acid-binding protein